MCRLVVMRESSRVESWSRDAGQLDDGGDGAGDGGHAGADALARGGRAVRLPLVPLQQGAP